MKPFVDATHPLNAFRNLGLPFVFFHRLSKWLLPLCQNENQVDNADLRAAANETKALCVVFIEFKTLSISRFITPQIFGIFIFGTCRPELSKQLSLYPF